MSCGGVADASTAARFRSVVPSAPAVTANVAAIIGMVVVVDMPTPRPTAVAVVTVVLVAVLVLVIVKVLVAVAAAATTAVACGERRLGARCKRELSDC